MSTLPPPPSAPGFPPPPSAPTRRWRRRLLLVLAAGAVVWVVVAVVTVVSSIGGKDLPAFDDQGRAVSSARRDAQASGTAALDGFDQRVARLGVQRIGGEGRRDRCQPGVDDFEHSDADAYVCSVTTARLYTFSGDFRSTAASIAARLATRPCPAGQITDVERTLRRDYDRNAGQLTPNFPQGIRPEAIQASSGVCVGPDQAPPRDRPGELNAASWLSIPVPASYDDIDPTVVPLPCPTDETYCSRKPLDVRAALRTTSAGDWAVVVTTSQDYWVVPWSGDGHRPDPAS